LTETRNSEQKVRTSAIRFCKKGSGNAFGLSLRGSVFWGSDKKSKGK